MNNEEAIERLKAGAPFSEIYCKEYEEAISLAIKALEKSVQEKPTGEWIPIKTRPMTTEERIEFADYYGIEYCDTASEVMFDCSLPEDGQEILISTGAYVFADVCCIDDGYGSVNCYSLEDRGDWEGVNAWMPMPEPYKKDDI